MQRLRRNTAARVGLVGGVLIVIALIVGGFVIWSTMTVTVPDANQPGDGTIGYVDITVSIPIYQQGGGCSATDCSIYLGPFSPNVQVHLTQPTAPVTIFTGVKGGTTVDSSCSLTVKLEVFDPNNNRIATQTTPIETINVGNNLYAAWGHVYIEDTGWHKGQYTVRSYGGGGCSDYPSTGVDVATTSAAFYVGEAS